MIELPAVGSAAALDPRPAAAPCWTPTQRAVIHVHLCMRRLYIHVPVGIPFRFWFIRKRKPSLAPD